MSSSTLVIGGGFAGLSAACYLQQAGHQVTLLEKHDSCGGRARVWESGGFRFDMGPSWYWMPEIFEEFFADFNLKQDSFYDLLRLDPSYRVFFSNSEIWDLPAGEDMVASFFEKIEKGSSATLKSFLAEGKIKYDAGMKDYTRRPSLSLREFIDAKMVREVFRLNMFGSFGKHVQKQFKDERIRKIVEFPVLFLGATAEKTPALYSMMTYADIVLGTWYPQGGMGKIVDGMVSVALSLGVKILNDVTVATLDVNAKTKKITRVKTNQGEFTSDVIVCAADYNHCETQLLSAEHRSYSSRYWEGRVMAPSCLLYYIGVNRKIPNLQHHNLFFDEDFDAHAASIYETKKWPEKPLLYVCAPSKTDSSVAPENAENLFILVPVASGLQDTEIVRAHYRKYAFNKLKAVTGVDVKQHVVVERSYAASDFMADYNSWKGNAYGLANTLWQTAFLKPKMHSKKVSNLYFAGQLTVPGPGVPPSLISGKVVAKLIDKGLSA
jgi:phytoene desaturase